MTEQLVVLDGSTFFVSSCTGDVTASEDQGFFFADTRHLSIWNLTVDGAPMHLLTAQGLDYYSARIVGTSSGARIGVHPTISVHRDRIVADGVHEDIEVQNHADSGRRVAVELAYGADFADLFEIKDQMPKRGRSWAEVDGQVVTLWYEHDGFRRGTRVRFDQPCDIGEDRARFDLLVGPNQRWSVCIDVSCVVEDEEHAPRVGHGGFGQLEPQMPLSLSEWMDAAPKLETDYDALRHAYQQSLVDLAALRFRPVEDLTWSLPAAGLPWFMALFGRDSLLTAYQALPFHARLATTTLEALAACQAQSHDPFRDAEPGKILHELRRGELTVLGESPHSPYYGTHDATPLFLVLLDEYERWTGDVEFVRSLESAARAALAWIEGPGDRDGDGYLEYETRSPKGLVNQGWKDSWNSMLFADGRVAEPPIATCEIQGYAYDARRRAARLAREIWEDPALGEKLEVDAAKLRDRFNRDFWNDERGHFVLALDGAKRPVDALTSNVGHLLWSGIVDDRYAAATVQRLLAEDMFSGWGIRTMSTRDAGYNPIEYHNGTVWPHDTGIIAEGFRRYGFRAEASMLAAVLIEAAERFAYRLPEVFAGFARDETVVPVEYPTASRPQAWSAGAPLLAIRTFLGLDAIDGKPRVMPSLPPGVRTLRLRGLVVHGHATEA